MDKIIPHHDSVILENHSDLTPFFEKLGLTPIYVEDESGVYRFQEKKIMRCLCDMTNMNDLWVKLDEDRFPMVELVQFYMDIGYTICGFEEIWGDHMDKVLGIKRDAETGAEYSRD